MKRLSTSLLTLALGCMLTFAQSDTALLPFRLFGGIEAGLSLQSGSMTRIANVVSCCAEFTSGSGFSFAVGGGIETPIGLRIGDENVVLGARVSYQTLPGSMLFDERIGVVIDDQTVTDGISRHDLSIGYAVLGVSPYVSLPVPIGMPLRARVGFTSGVPLSATFKQSESLLDPTLPGYTYENGQRTRNVGEGDIPNTAGLFAALNLGVQYEITISPSLAVVPSLNYQYALTNIATTTNWSASALRAGVDVMMRLAASPPPPPPPPPPTAPRIAELRSDLQIEAKRTDGVIDVVGVDNTVTTTIYDAAPVLFFEKGSTIPVVDRASSVGAYQQRVLEGLREYALANPSSRITVIGTAVTDEPPQLARERVTWAVAQLGIDAMSRIEVRTEVRGGYEYPQLADEQRSVRFVIDRVARVIPVVQRDTVRRQRDVSIPVTHILTCEAGPCTSTITATYGSRRVAVSGSAPVYRVQLPSVVTGASAEPLRVSCNVVDSAGATTTSMASANVRITASTVEEPAVRIQPSFLTDESIVLGYCDFDDDDFAMTNPDGIRRVREALASGKRVTIIASCDELGDDEYNDALMERRARSAIQILNARLNEVSILRQASSVEANATPMQRIANRSVRAVIK